MKNILLIEDNKFSSETTLQLKLQLPHCKYNLEQGYLYHSSLFISKNEKYDLIISNLDGHTLNSAECLLNGIIQHDSSTPLLIICTPEQLQHLYPCFEKQTYDFLIPPFTGPELKIRIKTLMQKFSPTVHSSFFLKSADLILNVVTRQAFKNERIIPLQNNEFELLQFFMKNTGKVITKNQIVEKIWNYRFDPQTNIVDVLVWRLRKKLDPYFNEKLIQTVRGVGYRFIGASVAPSYT